MQISVIKHKKPAENRQVFCVLSVMQDIIKQRYLDLSPLKIFGFLGTPNARDDTMLSFLLFSAAASTRARIKPEGAIAQSNFSSTRAKSAASSFEIPDTGLKYLHIIVTADIFVQVFVNTFAVTHFAQHSAVRADNALDSIH